MDTVIEQLQQLGFSEYETKTYIALLQENPLNGYALAKKSGVPRANIYGVLQKLEERGAAIAISAATGVVYSPVAPNDLIHRLGAHIGEVLSAAQRGLEALSTPVQPTYVQNLQGVDQLLEHARLLVDAAHERLLIALWQPEASALAEALTRAEARGVTITMLCCQACTQECGSCLGAVYRYRVTPDQQAHGLIVIRDDNEMLVGTTDAQATAIRTHQPNLIQMTTWYLRHSMTLAVVLADMGSGLESVLRPETRQLLQVIGDGDSWLEDLRRLLESGSTPDLM